MKDFNINLHNGISVSLNENEMYTIKEHYEIQCTADYLRGKYTDWSEEKIQEIATMVRYYMNKYDYTEKEEIYEVLNNYSDTNE